MKLTIRCGLMILLMGLGRMGFAQSFRDDRNLGFRNQNAPDLRNNYNNRSPYVSRIESAKENFMSSQLQLTPDEADHFWPIYRQYQQELSNVRRLKRMNNSNEQINGTDQINKEMYFDERLVDIRKHYNQEFLKILPPQKVSMIYKCERQFNDELIRQMGERRGRY